MLFQEVLTFLKGHSVPGESHVNEASGHHASNVQIFCLWTRPWDFFPQRNDVALNRTHVMCRYAKVCIFPKVKYSTTET